MSVAEALDRLLAGSGYVARQAGPTAWRVERRNAATPIVPAALRPVVEQVAAEPIIVTGAKRSAMLDALPMSVAVLRLPADRAPIAQQGTEAVAEAVDGLAMTSLGAGRNRLFLRGIADSPFNGKSQSTVAVVLDDARLTYAAPDPDIRLVDVERVEVLKGPQGSLYGSGSLGGIYHIVSRRAVMDETSLSMSGSAESVAHGGLGLNGEAVANLPLASGTAGLRLVGYAAREAGWINTGDRKDGNRNRVLGGRGNLGVEVGEWRADLSGLMQFTNSGDSGYVYAPGARSRPAQLPEPQDNDMRHVSLRLAREGPGMAITVSSGLSWHEVGDTLDATVGADDFGIVSPSVLNDERRYRVWDSEARLAGHAGTLRWLLGFSHVEAHQTARATLQSFAGSASIVDDDRRNTSDTALFGDITVPLWHALSLDAGVRLFHSVMTETSQRGVGPAGRERRRNGVTPSLALSWKPGSGEIVYLRYASAYRQGGSDIDPTGNIEFRKSDEVQTIEAGWRREVGRGGRLEFSLFASRWKNLQSDMLQPDGLIETINAGNAHILGGEASFDIALTDRLRLETGANLTNANLTRSMLGVKLDDRRLPVVPRFTLRAALTQDVALGALAARFRASLRYVGPQRLSFDPVVDRRMGSYVEDRIEAQTTFRGMRLSIAADNLFGGSDDSFAFGNPFRFANSRQYTPLRPASVMIGVAKDF